MTNDFDNVFLGELEPDKFAQAYGLARMAGEARDEAHWLARVKRWQNTPDESKKGVFAVQNAEGYVLALLYYSVRKNPVLGRILEVGDLTVPVMFKSSVIKYFIPILDQLAGMLDCWTICLKPKDSENSALVQMADIDGFQKEEQGIYRYLPVQKRIGL